MYPTRIKYPNLICDPHQYQPNELEYNYDVPLPQLRKTYFKCNLLKIDSIFVLKGQFSYIEVAS